jgi:hypothetical protein
MSDTSWPDVGFPEEEVDMVRVWVDGSRWALSGRTDEEWIEAERSAFVELPQ